MVTLPWLALDTSKYLCTESINILMLYFLLIGMISSRNSSFGACREIANATSIFSRIISNAGTTPEVESVTRRLDKP